MRSTFMEMASLATDVKIWLGDCLLPSLEVDKSYRKEEHGQSLLARGLIVFGCLDKEIGVACSINELFRQRRRNTIKFRNTNNLFD